MTKNKMLKVRNTIVAIFLSYLTLQIINYFVPSTFYLSLAINFSNRYMLFALAYFLICRNLANHEKQTKIFMFLVVSIFALTMSPIIFYLFDIKEFDLNDPLSSLTYINIVLHLLSLYTITFSIRIIRKINSSRANKKKFFYLPHIIYLTLMLLFVLNDFQISSIPPLYLDAIGLLGAMILIRSITRFQYIVVT